MIYKKALIAVVIGTFATGSYAQESIAFTGKLTAVAPEPVIQAPDIGFLAGVKHYDVVADPKTSICSFEESKDKAINGLDEQHWKCLFQWNADAISLNSNANELNGIFSGPGELSVPYEVYVFSGTTGAKTKVYEGSYEFDIKEPVAPKLVKLDGNWQKDPKSGLEQNNYNYSDKLTGSVIEVEERPYDQLITFNGINCEVPEGETQCDIVIEPVKFGDTQENPQGTENFPLILDSLTEYFSLDEMKLAVNWDYRPPELEGFVYNIGANAPEVETLSVGDTQIDVKKDEAVLAISSPHIDKSNKNFWKLQNNNFILTPSEGAEQSNTVTVNGRKMRFNIPHYQWSSKYTLPKISEERIGDLYVYRYDFAEVPDGKFDALMTIKDRYDNGGTIEKLNNLIDRFPPVVKVLKGDREMPYTTDAYFTSDFGGVASGGWDDGTKVTKITIGGVELPIEGEADNIKYASADLTGELERGEEYNLIVEAEDGAGNIGTEKITVRFNPSNYLMSGVPERLHRYVQKANINVAKTSGRCTIASSDEVAKLVASQTRKACTIEWTQIPAGMETSFIGWTNSLTGTATELGEQEIAYEVNFHDELGKKITMFSDSGMINVVPSDDLELSIKSRHELSDGVLGRPFNTNALGNYRFKTNPAAVNVHQIVDGGETETRDFGQLPFENNYELSGTIEDPKSERRDIWDRVTLDIKAEYALYPQFNTTKSVEVIQLPDQYVGTYVTLPDQQLKSTDSVPVKIRLGKYDNSDDSVSFDPSTMGEWTAYPALKVDGEYIQLAEPQSIGSDGSLTADIDASTLFEKGGALYSVANIESPHDEFERELISTPHYVDILKGTSVEGNLETRKRTGRIPFYANVQFRYDSLEDREVADNLRWEISEDGENWTVDETVNGKTFVNFKLNEPDNIFVRVKVDNKTTGEETVSQTLELASYQNARLGFEGPRQLYSGQEGEFKLTHYGEAIHPSEGIAQWSTDGGETWIDGGLTETFSFNQVGEVVELKARFKYNSTADIVGDAGWSEGTYYVQAVEPRKLTLSSTVPSLAEADTPMDIKGFARNPYANVPSEIITEWVLPDGSIVEDEKTTYTISAEELTETNTLDFTFRAWVDGYKDETFAERTATTRGWSYEFPDITMTLNTSVSVAPSNIFAAVQKPYVFAPGVEFGYEWIIDESKARIEYESGRTALIIAEESGMQQVKVRAYDNRGNEQVLTGYIDVLKPEDMSGEMKVYPSNRHFRAPLIVNLSASAQPGHPRDYATDFVWSLNGDVQEGEDSSVSRIEITEPGTYEVGVEITTEYGQVQSFTEEIIVVPNEKPICEPELQDSDAFVTLKTNCTDSDGRVIAYRWIWDGEEQGPYGTQIRFNKKQYPNLDVTFFAIDDSGGETQGEFNW